MGDARNRLVGRERESDRLADLVRSAPIVTLAGPGGVGKTVLARHVAELLEPELPAGVSWADLAPLESAADVPLAVASALGLRGTTRADAAAAVAEALADRDVLLVLDNCEHVTAGAARIAELAAAGAARVLATSRESLGAAGEHVLALEPLPLPEDDKLRSVAGSAAARLFAERAAAVRDGFRLGDDNAPAVALLCRRVDGLPLALELMAARIRSMSPEEIADRLEGPLSLAAGRKSTAARRHQSVRATVDWSYRLLAEDERAAFDRLGVFTTAVGASLIEEVCGWDPLDRTSMLELLGALVDRSLVTATEASGRTAYGMLETLRAYARERLAERGEAGAMGERHADGCAAWADGMAVAEAIAWSWKGVGFTRLEELEEPLAAIRWCLAHDTRAERTFRLLRPLWVVVHSRGAAEITELAERALERWPGSGDPLEHAVLGVAATGHFVLGDPQRARARALAAVEAGGGTALIALRALALTAYHFETDVAEAARLLADCAEAARTDGAEYVALEMTVLRAQALAATGDAGTGTALVEGVLARAEEARSPHLRGWTGYILGTILLHAGDLRGARDRFEESLALARSVDFPLTAGVSLRQLGVVAALEGDEARAGELIADSIEHFRDVGDRAQMWDALRSAAVALALRGDHDGAARLLAAADTAPGARTVPPLERPLVADARARVAAAGERAPGREERPDALAAPAVLRLRAGRPSPQARDAAAAPAAVDDACVFRRSGELWTLSYGGTSVQLGHLKGLGDIARLLEQPGEELHCLELAGDAGPAPVGGDLGEVLDPAARRAYRARAEQLREEIEDARRANDPVRAERAHDELAAVAAELESAYGLGGRVRRAGDPAERARTAVTWRIRHAVRKLDAEHPALGRHLRNAIRTGTWCSYMPESPVPWEL